MKYEQLRQHPELSPAAQKMFSDYASDGPFFDEERARELGTAPHPKAHPNLNDITDSDLSFLLRNKKEGDQSYPINKAIIRSIMRDRNSPLSDDMAEQLIADHPQLMLAFDGAKVTPFFIEKMFQKDAQKRANNEEGIDPFILESMSKKQGTDEPRDDLTPETIKLAMNHPDDSTKSVALRSGKIPYEILKQFKDHPNFDIRHAYLKHPDMPDSDLKNLLTGGGDDGNADPDKFYEHPKTPELLKKDPEIYKNSNFSPKGYIDTRRESGKPLSHDEVLHILDHTPSERFQPRDNRSIIHHFLDSGNFVPFLSDPSRKEQAKYLINDLTHHHFGNDNWTQDHSKAVWNLLDKNIQKPEGYDATTGDLMTHIFRNSDSSLKDDIFDHLVKKSEHPSYAEDENLPSKITDLVNHTFYEDPEKAHAMLLPLLKSSNKNVVSEILDSSVARQKAPEKDTEYANTVKGLIDGSNDQIAGKAVKLLHPDDIEKYIDHPKKTVRDSVSTQLDPMGIYPEDQKIKVPFDTGKLRIARDIAQEMGGKIHKKELEKRGLNPAALKITHLQDGQGNIKAEDLQSHIDSLPANEYGFSFGKWTGAQKHSDAPSTVFQLKMTKDHIQKLKEEGLWDIFKYIESESSYPSHPNAKNNGLGWVRYTEGAPEKKSEPKKPKVMIDMPGHPSHGRKATIQSDYAHPQTGAPGYAVSFDEPIHMAANPGDPETEHPAGTMAWLGHNEIDVPGSNWKRVPEAPQEEQKPQDNYHIDEVQSDFGQALGRSAMAFASRKYSHESESERAKQFAKEYEEKAPSAKRERISQILFGGKPTSEALHEAFHQFLRKIGKAGSKVAIWQVKPKAGISLGSQTEDVPVHFKQGYEEIPKKMGYNPGKYGNLPTQTSQSHQGKDTWEQTLRKMEDLRNRLRSLSKRMDS